MTARLRLATLLAAALSIGTAAAQDTPPPQPPQSAPAPSGAPPTQPVQPGALPTTQPQPSAPAAQPQALPPDTQPQPPSPDSQPAPAAPPPRQVPQPRPVPNQTPQPSAPGSAQSLSTFEPNDIRAWSMLSEAAASGKSAHDRIQALAALGSMGNDERAARLISEAMSGHDMDVRTAAVLAAGETGNPHLVPKLREALDDDNPQVAFAAALTLWKLRDDSGEDLLLAVSAGDRKTAPGLLKSSRHKAVKEMQDPKKLATLGINSSAGFFLGPFGVGLKAIEYANKDTGAADARAAAIDQLALRHSTEVRDTLADSLADPEPAVRAAAAKALGTWPGPETGHLLAPLFGDNHLAVRLTAAAAFLRSQHNIPPTSECASGPWVKEAAHGRVLAPGSSH